MITEGTLWIALALTFISFLLMARIAWMKISKGDARALASAIRVAIHRDMSDRQGLGDSLNGIDPEIREELNQEHTDVIAKEIEKFLR